MLSVRDLLIPVHGSYELMCGYINSLVCYLDCKNKAVSLSLYFYSESKLFVNIICSTSCVANSSNLGITFNSMQLI